MCICGPAGKDVSLCRNVMLWVPNSAGYFCIFLSPGKGFGFKHSELCAIKHYYNYLGKR